MRRGAFRLWIRVLGPAVVAALITSAHAQSASGDATEKAPTSKDALFDDDATDGKIGLHGFVDVLPAYTYSSPAHWSRAVARLQASATGAFSESVKWKLGARVDVDPVYFGSNFYLEPVKKDERFDFFYRENYLDLSAGDWDLRIGAQQIVWGEVVGIFVADVVSARDLREFLLPSFDIIRIPQPAVRAEYSAGNAHVEFVWIPTPAFDDIGKPGSDFYPVRLPSPTSAEVADIFQDPVRPERKPANSNYGVRANTTFSGFDVAAFYYRSFSAQPTFYRVASFDPVPSVVFQPRYDRIWQVGGTMSKDLADAVLRAEVVYTNGQNHAVTDLAAPNGVVKASTVDYAVSLDFTLPHDTHLNIQGFQRVFTGGTPADLALKVDGFGASIFVSSKFGRFEPQLTWLQNFKSAGGLIRPRLNWIASQNTTVGFGVDVFTGPSDGFFGRYNNRDRVYAEVRYDF